MRYILLITMVLLAFVVSCSEDNPAGVPPNTNANGTVVVFVAWDGEGLPGMRVELLELGIEKRTNEEGFAEFVVPAGNYTVRAYDINQGGPPRLYVDREIVVEPKQTTRVTILNCLVCV